MRELPGHLQPVYQKTKWLDLVMKSDLPDKHKLVAMVLYQSTTYNRQHQLALSIVSNYSISRYIKTNSEEAERIRDDLESLGWIFNTGLKYGAKFVHALTFSLVPLGKMRT